MRKRCLSFKHRYPIFALIEISTRLIIGAWFRSFGRLLKGLAAIRMPTILPQRMCEPERIRTANAFVEATMGSWSFAGKVIVSVVGAEKEHFCSSLCRFSEVVSFPVMNGLQPYPSWECLSSIKK